MVETIHGSFATPAFVVVGTRAAIRAVTTEMARALGATVLLGNTYHLHLAPGAEVVAAAGGLGKFMNWSGPTMTDSGGFQVFSLGAGFGQKISKIAAAPSAEPSKPTNPSLVKIDEDGVTFRSCRDGSTHRFTPEKSLQIQHALGADIIFAFDECPSPRASVDYQRQAMDRTHVWADRSLAEHRRLGGDQALFGIVQGGRFPALRSASAKIIGGLDFAGFGIGGSFNKADIESTVASVNRILPASKPRHLLGIGAVADLFAGIESGVDTFDCVAPTRLARHGALETKHGRINILRAAYRADLAPVEADCTCYTCQNYTRSYLAHLFRVKEMLGPTLASIHNLYFFVNLVKQIRQSILDDRLRAYREQFLASYTQLDLPT